MGYEELYELLIDNVDDIFIQYHLPQNSDLKNSVIDFICDNYNLNIARDSRYLPTAVEVACRYITNKPVMTRQLIPLYFYFENPKVDLLRNKYCECRKLIIRNYRIINLVFGTKITSETPRDKLFSIHEKIKNLGVGLRFERSHLVIERIKEKMQTTDSKPKLNVDELEDIIKKIMIAFDTISVIESKETKKIQKLVSDVNRECYGYISDDHLDKIHNGKK